MWKKIKKYYKMDKEQIQKIKDEITKAVEKRMDERISNLEDLYNNNRYSDRITFEKGVEMLDRLFIKDVTQSQITANQNNYEIGNYTVIRLSTDASRDITGIKGGLRGRILIIINVGAEDLVLKDEDANSDAKNRIATNSGADITLGSECGAFLLYDITSLRWRLILNS